jgi:hypothetical protein
VITIKEVDLGFRWCKTGSGRDIIAAKEVRRQCQTGGGRDIMYSQVLLYRR